MAIFILCFDQVIGNFEGGYKLHHIKGDRGGETFAGISRVNWPKWEGWKKIDKGEFDEDLEWMVHQFYVHNFWNKIQGNKIESQKVALLLFDFAVNAHILTSIRMAQKIIGVKADGVVGPKTLAALNAFTEDEKEEYIFMLSFSLEKVFYYKNCAWKDKRRKQDKIVSNMKFLCGWINRVEKGIKG